ncbi:MAG: hypothetical protein NT009_01470 [Proteobacteria bacterium]|nr:hypothetical protein [Pseudomonadota bacterium]
MGRFRVSPGLWLAGFLLVASLPLSAPSAFPADTEGRAVFSLGYNDNVRDTPSDLKKGDFLYRMILEGRTRVPLLPALAFSGTIWNGAEFLFVEKAENRLRQNLSLRVTHLNRFFTGDLKGTLENSFYPWKENYYYLKPGAQLELSRPLNPIFTVGISGNYQFFNYHPEDNLNYHLLSWAAQVRAQVSEELSPQLSGGQSWHWYGSLARVLNEDGNLVPGFKDRADAISEVSGSLSFSRKFLLKPAYSFQKGVSNAFGLSYINHRVSLTFSYPFPTKTLLHLFAVIQVKKYGGLGTYTIWAEDRRIILADEQDENLNAINVRVEQKMNKYLSLQLTYNRYSNEFSKSRPYSKNLILLGVRFGT